MDRRGLLKGIGLGAVAATAGGASGAAGAQADEVRARVSPRSEPSQLRITDLRVVNVHGH